MAATYSKAHNLKYYIKGIFVWKECDGRGEKGKGDEGRERAFPFLSLHKCKESA